MPPGIAQMSASDLIALFEAKTAARGITLDEAWDEIHADWEADRDGWRRTLASELEAGLLAAVRPNLPGVRQCPLIEAGEHPDRTRRSVYDQVVDLF